MMKRLNSYELSNSKLKRSRVGTNYINRDVFVYKLDDWDQDDEITGNPWDNMILRYQKINRYPYTRVHFVSESSVQLNFNYWQQIRGKYILGSDLPMILTWLLEGRSDLSVMSIPKPADHVVVVTVKGIDPATLTNHIQSYPNSSFALSSSIPIRYCSSESKSYVDRNTWRPMDVEDVTSLALWPKIPLSGSHVINSLTDNSLFNFPVVVAKAWFIQWNDYLLLSPNDTSTFQTKFNQSLELKIDEFKAFNISNESHSWLSELLPLLPTDKIGEVRRSQVADSGMFLFRKSENDIPSLLYLVWNQLKAGIQLFIHSPRVQDSNEAEPISAGKWIYYLEQSTAADAIDFESTCIDFVAVIEQLSASRCLSTDEDNAGKENASTDICDDKSLIQPCIDRISCIYESISQSSLDSLLLSTELLDVYGYDKTTMSFPPIYIEAQRNIFSITKATAIVEDGEEIEEVVEITSSTEVQLKPTDYQAICAIDCEMSYTNQGLELTRISLVSPNRGVLYDTLVKPTNAIIDYNTSYSGITEESMRLVETTMKDVHNSIRRYVGSDTILVGHSLDSDLKALQLSHPRIIDTSALYPHIKGLPYKQSLKHLAKKYLNLDIQESQGAGHDSVLDALVSLELSLVKAKNLNSNVSTDWLPCEDSTFPRYSLTEQVSKAVADFRMNVYSEIMHPREKPWERYAVGYKPATSATALESEKVSAHRFEKADSLVDACIASMKELSKDQSSTRNLTWIELCGFDDAVDHVNDLIARLYESLPSNSVFINLVQADIRPTKVLSAKKQISKWDAKIMTDTVSKGSSYEASEWTEEDERAMIIATAHAICGSMFIRYKT